MQMPVLENRGHETYARARARGLGPLEAYVAAGYRPTYTSGARLGRRPEVAARIVELREREPEPIEPGAAIARLLRLADAGQTLNNAAGLRESRMALMEAYRLQGEQNAPSDWEPERHTHRRQLTVDEWLEKYAPPGSLNQDAPSPSAAGEGGEADG
ncbi:MAG: hypothetical protein ABI306_06325 [Caulobacteraceae bacterium]